MDKKVREERHVKLDLLHAFGSLGYMEFKDGVVFVDDGKIKLGYPVGKFFATRAIDKHDMNFIKLNDNLDRIMSICVSKNRKTLAISQKIKGDNFPQVAIYQVRGGINREREKIYRYTETKSDAFVHMAFGEDPRFLVLLTGYADCQLIFLDTSRMREMATAILGLGANRVSMSPKDNHIVAVTGDRFLKIYRVHETSFKSMGDITGLNFNQKFTDHAWVEDQRLLVTNDAATVYVIQQAQVVQVINNCFNFNSNDPTTSITTISVFARGFIVGSDNGTLAVWTKDDYKDEGYGDKLHYSYLRTKKTPIIKNQELAKRRAIVSMDVNPNQDLLAICFKNNDIATVSLNQLAPIFEDNTDSFKIKKILEKDIQLNYLYNGFHSGPVTCIDVCIQRPIIATCSTYDSTIRLWNYSQAKSELVVTFNKPEDARGESSPVLSLALHPSGYYMAVGFSDRLEIFHICSEELRSFRKLMLKNVTCLKFSRGGHMLAAAYPKPNQSHYFINIFNTYTLDSLIPYPLRGPVNAITDILWSKKDEFIYSCGLDGSLFEWKMYFTPEEPQRNEFGENMSKFTALAYTYNGMILACGNENGNGIVKEIKPKDNYEKVHRLPWGRLTQIVSFKGFYNTPAIVGGTSSGVIKVFPEIFSVEAYDSIYAHLDEINKIVTSPDGRYVFSIGKDHAVLIFQVTEVTEGGMLVSRSGGADDPKEINPCALAVDDVLANFVLLSRNEIEKFRAEIKQLRIEVEDLQDKILISAEEDRKKMEEDQASAEQVMRGNVKTWEDKYSELQKQKNQLEKEYANLLKQMESNHMRAVEELENLYEKKLSYENDKYVKKEEELNNLKTKNMDVLEKLNRDHEETIDKLEKEYRDEFGKIQRVFETNKNTADQIKMEYEEKLNEIEEEHETEIKELKSKQKKEIDDKKTEIARLRHENERFRRDQKETKEEKINLQKSEEEKEVETKQLQADLNEARTTVEMLKKEIENEEERINKKNKKIYDYKSKISDLQKSKHVLSYRTAEMRKSLEPKEAQIEKLKEELFKLEKEFEGMLKTGQVQNEKLNEKETKIEELTEELKTQTALCNKRENLIQKIIMDIYQSVKTKEPKELGGELRRLFKDYCDDVELKQENHDPRSVEEMVRQVQHLEKSITQMGRSTEKMVKRREQDIYRKTMENSDLICDLNDLRKANKKLESDIYNLTKQNENLVKEQKNIREDITKMKSIMGRLRKEGPEASQNATQYVQNNEQRETIKMPPLFKAKSNDQNNQKGKLIKGSMFDLKAQSINDRNKLVEVMAEIEMSNKRIMQQDEQLRRMREKLESLQQERGPLKSQEGVRPYSHSSFAHKTGGTQQNLRTDNQAGKLDEELEVKEF